jgi:anti-anti-sigma regulatory factor/PAS domain-containing protein
MASVIGLLGLEAEALARGSAEERAHETLAGVLPALEWLKDMASTGGVLVVGPGVLDPVRFAERALALSRRVEVILAAPPERHAKQLAEMQRSSLLGSAVPCVSLGEPEALALAITEAAARIERRQRYRAVASRAGAKIQALPGVAPKRSQYIDQLWKNVPLGVLVLSSSDLQILDGNPRAQAILGLSEGHSQNQRLDGFFPEEDRPTLRDLLRRPPGADAHEPPVFTLRRAEGPRYVEIIAAEGEVGRTLVVLLQDITERRRVEDDLRQHVERIALQEQEIRTLSVPIVKVWEGVLLLPIVGLVDEARTARMMETLLSAVVTEAAGRVILDLTGVESVDRTTADGLLAMVRTAALLGSRCTISGVSPDVARTFIALDVDLGGLSMFRDLHSALREALASPFSDMNDGPRIVRR